MISKYYKNSATLKYSLLILVLVCLSACVSGHQMPRELAAGDKTAEHRAAAVYCEKVASLKVDLAALNRQANIMEAGRVAKTAIQYSAYLAEKYEVVRPAVLHNVLIRLGLKNRGLCYHWTEDLLKKLRSLDLRTYQLHWGVAHQGSELREHNSVVISSKGQAFEEGMVLDPWRNSGDLYWALVKADRYPWKALPPAQW